MFVFSPRKSVVCELMWIKYWTARQVTDDVIWRTRISCWIPKATNEHSEYVILGAFPLQQWFTNSPRFDFIRALPVANSDSRCRSESILPTPTVTSYQVCVADFSGVNHSSSTCHILFISYLLTSCNFVSTPPRHCHCPFAMLLF